MTPRIQVLYYQKTIAIDVISINNIQCLVCPNSTIFQPTDVPASPLLNDGQVQGGIEVGVKFRVTQNGYITGFRFYKGAGNTGTHIGHLWSSTGTLLASATFTGNSFRLATGIIVIPCCNYCRYNLYCILLQQCGLLCCHQSLFYFGCSEWPASWISMGRRRT